MLKVKDLLTGFVSSVYANFLIDDERYELIAALRQLVQDDYVTLDGTLAQFQGARTTSFLRDELSKMRMALLSSWNADGSYQGFTPYLSHLAPEMVSGMVEEVRLPMRRASVRVQDIQYGILSLALSRLEAEEFARPSESSD
jgi:hypothetical protein